MIEFIKHSNFNFMRYKYLAVGFSAVMALIGLLAIVQIARGTANLGIDFAGGTAVQVKLENAVTLSQVRSVLSSGGFKAFELQDFPAFKKVLITLKAVEDTGGSVSDKVIGVLDKGLPGNKVTVDSVMTIGPKVGKRLRVDALWAVIASTIGILLYVSWRFQFRFSVGATVATFHDVLAVLALFYILGLEINLILLTALLTIAGYSLTDTVVVFDRIRENLRLTLKEPVESVINRSINEVLSRTIITSFTVLLASIALYLFGGEVLHDFALAMILGVIIGTYSSIFVASPVVMFWGGSRPLVKK